MSVIKEFQCVLFNPNNDCPFTVTGEENEIIDFAARHEQIEHNIEDTPETRNKIKESLIDPQL